MSVVPGGGGNRNALNLPIGPDGQRDWSHDGCDCKGHGGLFCRACCDPCVVYGRNKQRYEHLVMYGTPDPQEGEGMGTGRDACQKHAFVTCFFAAGWLFQIRLRGRIRERYGIRGSCMGDCCRSSLCQPCSLMQESLELKLEEDDFRARAGA
ncbi:PLAC8 family-domain-containing protein [Schizophyllum fasciatum]